MKVYCLRVGDHLISDILNPQPGQIDLKAIDQRLRVMHRWSNDPQALTVHQHRNFVVLMMQERGESEQVVEWGHHHDDHEAIIGDIPGPIKSLIAHETHILYRLEDGLDRAICAARGIQFPSKEVRKRVHLYDKASETAEWLWVLKQPPAPWNRPLPPDITEERLQELLQLARAM